MFTSQLLEAVSETALTFITGVQRLTKPISRDGNGYSRVSLENGNNLAARNAPAVWTISLQEKLMATFPELNTPAHVKLAVELAAALPGSPIGIAPSRTFKVNDQGNRVPDGFRTSRQTGQLLHDVFVRRTTRGGVDPTDESIEAPEAPKPVDPTVTPDTADLGV